MNMPPLFRDRPRAFQIVLGGVVPFAFGAVVGVVVGISSGAYWGLAALAAIGGVLAGLEHRDGWGGADRGLVGGALFGTGLLIAHAIAGTQAKVSLGSFPPLLVVIDAFVGIMLGALGGRLARALRERPSAALGSTQDTG
jgi:hypothetical protein